MPGKDGVKAEKKDRRVRSEDQSRAATIAISGIMNPEEERLVEVSNIPIGAAHALTMLLSYEEQVNTTIDQIRAVQMWYILRTFQRKYGKEWQPKPKVDEEKDPQQLEYQKAVEELVTSDTIDIKELFIHRFTQSYFKVSRGKEAKLLGIAEVLADTDLQTRSVDLEESFRSATHYD